MNEAVSRNIHTVRTTDYEEELLKKTGMSYSEFSHQAFKWLENGKKYEWMKDISSYFLIIMLGLGFFGLSYLIIMIFPKILMILLSVFCICFGTLAIIQERRSNDRRFRNTSP